MRNLALLLVAVCLLGVVGVFVLTRPAVLTPLLRSQLAAATRTEATLNRASVSLGGVVRLEGLRLELPPDAEAVEEGTPEAKDQFRQLLDVDQLTVRVGRRDLLKGRLNLQRIQVIGPTLHAVLDGLHSRSNLRVWADRFGGGEEPGGERGPVALPPAITVIDGALLLVELDAGPDGAVVERTSRRLPFDGTVIPRGTTSDPTLAFALAGGTPEGSTEEGTDLTGEWQPMQQELKISVERMDLASPLGLLMPPAVRRYWRDLAPAGALPALTLETRLDRGGADLLKRARMEVRGLSFRLPLASLGLLPEGDEAVDAPRMSGVTGSLGVENGQLSTEGLTGEIEGIRYRITGSTALDGDGPVDLIAETEAFDVPASPPLLFRLPGVISQVYGEYRPSGRFSARVAINREAGRPVQLEGRVEVIDASALFHGFPYPLEHLGGAVSFDRHGLSILGLEAEAPGGGRVILDGEITDPGPEAGIDLAIRALDVSVDGTLLGSMDPHLREVIAGFFSTADAERLARTASPGTVRAFEPGGRVNGTVRVLRDTSIRPKSWVELDLDPEGLRLLLPEFAYPLTVRSGRVQAGPEEVTLDDLVVTGPTGGAGVVRGRVGLGHPESGPDVDLRLSEVSLPIDRHLLAALDEDATVWLRRLGVGGRVTGGGRVGGPSTPAADGTPRLGLALDLSLADGRMSLWGGDVALAPVEAEVRVSRDAVRIDRLEAPWPGGANGEGRLTAEGRIGLPDGDLRLDLGGTGLAVSEQVAMLIPPELAARPATLDFLREYELRGTADAVVTLRTRPGPTTLDGEQHGPEVLVDVRPLALSGVYDGLPVSLAAMSGAVSFTDDAAILRSVSGRGEASDVTVSGQIPWAAGEPTELEIDASGEVSDGVIQAFLPAALRDGLAAVGLEGRVTTERAALRLGPAVEAAIGTGTETEPAPAATPAPLPFAFSGRIDLMDAEASLGLPLTRGRLSAQVDASSAAGSDWPEVRVRATSPDLRYADREVRSVRFHADNLKRPAVMEIRDLSGSVSGGRLLGRAAVRLGDDEQPGGPPPGSGGFEVDLSIDGAAAEPLLFPDDPVAMRTASLIVPTAAPDPEQGGPPAETSPPQRGVPLPGGRLSASLTAAGEAGLPDTLTGRGRVRVRDGDLLRGQWGIGLLRAVNLGLPSGAPLGDADAEFVLVNGRARIRQASVGGAGLLLAGTGWVDFPSGKVYLTLFTSRERYAWLQGVQRLFDIIKDEFIGIEVSGTVWDPTARVSSLGALRGEVEDRLGETAPPLVRPPPTTAPEVTRSLAR